MTVAFEFEDKKEEEENPGKVKVRSAGFILGFTDLFTGFNIAGLELNWVCVFIPALPQKELKQNACPTTAFLGIFGSHIPLKVEVIKGFAASWNVQWRGHHL